MSKLQRALTQTRIPGIYRIESKATLATLRAETESVEWRLFYLDGSKIRDKKTFLDKIARAMEFPAYFGRNWDAFNDCLTDLGWAPAQGYVVLFQAPERLVKNSPADWDVAIDIFSSAIEFWQEQGTPLYLLLRGGAPVTFPSL